MDATTYGLDVAKRVFQLYWIDVQSGEIVNRRFGRDELIGFLAQRPAGPVALEACGSGHWWARKINRSGLWTPAEKICGSRASENEHEAY
ncbi:hypothetical protein SBBP2_2400024 [Burkholderiales bacterium]|jgi:transposase|nr:hypothetical protein SBBP2_2400024 [Burkholderiales bacterium]